jgi:hypothetical protein
MDSRFGTGEQPAQIVRRQRRALVVSFIWGWAVSEMHARTASVQLDPFALMTSAKQLPTDHFTDYSFVF